MPQPLWPWEQRSAEKGDEPDLQAAHHFVAKKYKEVRKALRAAGWRPIRQRGSHEVWAHPGYPLVVTVAGKDRQEVPVGTLAKIRRISGLKDLR